MGGTARRPGVLSPEELREFVTSAGDTLVVVDARSMDFSAEPEDRSTHQTAPIAGTSVASPKTRARAVNLPWNRPLERPDNFPDALPSDWVEAAGGREKVPIVTHCNGGGRGEKMKQFLKGQGFLNCVNGGGPKDTENWAVFGDK